MRYDIIIIGGGAAGFFAAINAAELKPDAKILILERGKEVLTKVKISGGGRCNVTHAEFIPKELIKNYPRGEKELRGPFHQFMTGDTIAWFEQRGVALKTEDDGRMFPISNSSDTIIDCFLSEAKKLNIEIRKSEAAKSLRENEGRWEIKSSKAVYSAVKIIVATGSNPKIWNILQQLGHSVTPAVPSLFTFNIKDKRIKDLPGISTYASVKVPDAKLQEEGPLLITHWGLSGPAILKLSAWGARQLHEMNYQFKITVNWLPGYTSEEMLQELKELKFNLAKQLVYKNAQFELPKRLWQSLVHAAGITEDISWADINKKQLQQLSQQLTAAEFQVNGKSTFKEEFVTAGGVALKEVNFKSFESKLHKNLFFAGEVLNIDAITGGFNFQNAWTGAYIAASAVAVNDS